MYVIKECPHVFFIGNQERFETRLVEGDISPPPDTLVVVVESTNPE